MSLDHLLNEIIKLKKLGGETKILSKNKSGTRVKTGSTATKILGPMEVYSLGKKHANVYFTKREAECMLLLLRGKTILAVAESLHLSPRTVEYYVKNMKSKLGCRTKFELVDTVHASEFITETYKQVISQNEYLPLFEQTDAINQLAFVSEGEEH